MDLIFTYLKLQLFLAVLCSFQCGGLMHFSLDSFLDILTASNFWKATAEDFVKF